MLKININEKKKLKFSIRVSGVEPRDLRGSMKIMVEGVEYGFPIKIDEGDVVVDISPLSTVTGKEFKDGDIYDAQLDIIAGDIYLNPWSDKVMIESPLKVEATLSEIEEIKETKMPEISISALEEEVEKETKPIKVEKKEPKTKFGKMLED